MRGAFFRRLRQYILAIVVVAVGAVIVATVFLTEDRLQWAIFLTGILVATVLTESVKVLRAEWVLMRRTAQLASMKEKYEQEAGRRRRAEEKNADAQVHLRLMEETLSTMIVLFDADGNCRYHNRAFRDWLNLKAEFVDGKHIRLLLGSKAYSAIATAVRQSLDGQSLHYEHFQEMSGRAVYRLLVDHAPQFDAVGNVTGFFFLAEDITKRGDLSPSATNQGRVTEKPANVSVREEYSNQDMFIDDFSGQIDGRHDEGKFFIAAIQRGEFTLYCQLISPLPVDSGKTVHYEILIRLMEEEGCMIPPGAFFPLAERNGLMPYLDRWVVQHVLQWVANQRNLRRNNDSIFFINVAAATIGDPEFPAFLQKMLAEYGMPGSVFCFEVAESDLAARRDSIADFIRQVRLCGCLVALSGFGRDGVSFDNIRGFQVDFLKIDGGTIVNVLSNPINQAKVVAIDRVAKKIGVKTVAEMVESDEITAKLCEIGIDFAQGFGISRPRRLME
ncbi:MAG: EAL domain-containing protein [Gallionella sp.]|nr:EAL domain-containing protein [Gallionella sp.]